MMLKKILKIEELEEKFDKHIESIKHKFAELKCHQEYYYNQKFNRIIENFESAKKYGSFPVLLTAALDYSKLTATGSNITSSFVIRCGTDNAGYYTIGAGNVRYYMNKKPNWLVRNCAKIFFDFTWKDK